MSTEVVLKWSMADKHGNTTNFETVYRVPSWHRDRQVHITPSLATALKIPAGEYNHTSGDDTEKWEYTKNG
jgi:hypothetical protein